MEVLKIDFPCHFQVDFQKVFFDIFRSCVTFGKLSCHFQVFPTHFQRVFVSFSGLLRVKFSESDTERHENGTENQLSAFPKPGGPIFFCCASTLK